jgi:hypothetical protein
LRLPLTGHFDSSSTARLPGFFYALTGSEARRHRIQPSLKLRAYRFVNERVQHEYRLVRRVALRRVVPTAMRQARCEKHCAATL